MKTVKVDTKFWSRLNAKTNMASFLTHMYGLEKIKEENGETTLLMNWDKVPMMKNSYGTAINSIAKVCTPVQMIELIDKSYSRDESIYLFNRFTQADSDNLVIYPSETPRMMEIIPDYCEKCYPGKYDFEFNVENGLRQYNVVIYLENIDVVMEDVSFLLLQDADIHGIYEYKIKNGIPLEQYVDREELIEKELI